jgi:hypothetical protein
MNTDFEINEIYEDHEEDLRELKKVFISKFIDRLESININIEYVIVSFNNTANLTDEDTFIISIDCNGVRKYGSVQFAKYGRKKIMVGNTEMYKLNYQKIKNSLSHYKFSVCGLKVDNGVLKQIDYTKRSKSCKKFMQDKTIFNYGRKKKIDIVLNS